MWLQGVYTDLQYRRKLENSSEDPQRSASHQITENIQISSMVLFFVCRWFIWIIKSMWFDVLKNYIMGSFFNSSEFIHSIWIKTGYLVQILTELIKLLHSSLNMWFFCQLYFLTLHAVIVGNWHQLRGICLTSCKIPGPCVW